LLKPKNRTRWGGCCSWNRNGSLRLFVRKLSWLFLPLSNLSLRKMRSRMQVSKHELEVCMYKKYDFYLIWTKIITFSAFQPRKLVRFSVISETIENGLLNQWKTRSTIKLTEIPIIFNSKQRLRIGFVTLLHSPRIWFYDINHNSYFTQHRIIHNFNRP